MIRIGKAGRLTRIIASPTIFRPFLKAQHIIVEILDLLKSLFRKQTLFTTIDMVYNCESLIYMDSSSVLSELLREKHLRG